MDSASNVVGEPTRLRCTAGAIKGSEDTDLVLEDQ
jgi:hypothetical protein